MRHKLTYLFHIIIHSSKFEEKKSCKLHNILKQIYNKLFLTVEKKNENVIVDSDHEHGALHLSTSKTAKVQSIFAFTNTYYRKGIKIKIDTAQEVIYAEGQGRFTRVIR